MGKAVSFSVDGTGAWPGDRLMGYKQHNLGLVLELKGELKRRDDGKFGRIQGVKLKVIAAGAGDYKEMWQEFEGRVVEREDIASWIKRKRDISPEFCAAYPRLKESFNGLNANCLINISFAKYEVPSKSEVKKKKAGLGCLLLASFSLLVAVAFLFAPGKILANVYKS